MDTPQIFFFTHDPKKGKKKPVGPMFQITKSHFTFMFFYAKRMFDCTHLIDPNFTNFPLTVQLNTDHNFWKFLSQFLTLWNAKEMVLMQFLNILVGYVFLSTSVIQSRTYRCSLLFTFKKQKQTNKQNKTKTTKKVFFDRSNLKQVIYRHFFLLADEFMKTTSNYHS